MTDSAGDAIKAEQVPVKVTWGCEEGHEPFMETRIGSKVLYFVYEYGDPCPVCEAEGQENPATVQSVETHGGQELEFHESEYGHLGVPRYER